MRQATVAALNQPPFYTRAIGEPSTSGAPKKGKGKATAAQVGKGKTVSVTAATAAAGATSSSHEVPVPGTQLHRSVCRCAGAYARYSLPSLARCPRTSSLATARLLQRRRRCLLRCLPLRPPRLARALDGFGDSGSGGGGGGRGPEFMTPDSAASSAHLSLSPLSCVPLTRWPLRWPLLRRHASVTPLGPVSYCTLNCIARSGRSRGGWIIWIIEYFGTEFQNYSPPPKQRSKHGPRSRSSSTPESTN